MIIELTNCDTLTITSEEGILQNVGNTSENICCVQIEIGQNCCEPAQLVSIPINRTFTVASVNAAGEDTIGYYVTLALDYTVLDVECISQIEQTVYGQTIIQENPTDWETATSFKVYFEVVAPGTTYAATIKIYTCSDLYYTLDFVIDYHDALDPVAIAPTISGEVTTQPELPTGITFSMLDDTLTITSEYFGTDTILDGVYCFTLTQVDSADTLTEETGHFFVDCTVKCKVIDHIATNLESELYLLYDALVQAANCTTVTCQQMCDLWYYIGAELDYFDESPCYQNNDCGCV